MYDKSAAPFSLVSVSFCLLYFFFCFSSDVEFGRLQARDMLQHLWTGPISNAAVDVVQGSRSVEVRSVGVTKVHAQNIHFIKDHHMDSL